MTDGVTFAEWLIIAATSVLIILDLILLAIYGSQATFSRVILAWSRKWPIIPFAAGVLCGHLFWPQP